MMKNRKTFHSVDDNADHLPQVPYLGHGFYSSVNDLDAAALTEKPALLTGLQSGDVGLLFSDSALSQSNFLLQLAVSLAAGEAFPSLLPAPKQPRRVLYLNPTWRLSRFRQQLNPLFNSLPDAEIARKHLQLSVEPQHTGRPLNLNLDTHHLHLKLTLKVLQPEVIIIDDLLSLFPDFADEETGFNARHLLYRLQGIAEGCKCVLLAGYVLPRGGGNRRVMNGLSRVADAVFRLEKPRRAASSYLFRCEQSRGELPKSVLLEWQEEDWRFVISDEQPSLIPKKLPTVEEIVAFVEAEHGAKTGEIIRHFAERACPRKMAYLLKDANLLGKLYKAETGYWLIGDGIEEIGGKSKQAEQSFEVFGMEGLEGSEGLRHILEWEKERQQQEEGRRGRGEQENGAEQVAATSVYVCAERDADLCAVVRADFHAELGADSDAEGSAEKGVRLSLL